MKKTLLLLFACLFGALSGVKAWTSVKPYVGRSYYLLNANYERYWYSIKDNGFHITDDLSAANRVTFESANGSNYAFAYYLNDTKYYLHESGGNADWPTNSNTMDVGTTNHGYYFRNDPDWNITDGDRHRYMNAHSDTGISFGRHSDSKAQNDKARSWQFISVYEMDSNTPNICATEAKASYLSEANGWERVTDNTTLDASLSDYFFAIVCANYPGLMVNMADGNASQQAGGGYTGSKSMWYSNSANPEVDNSFLWMIEANTTPNYEGYTFRNASYPSLTIQTEWNTGGWGMSWYAHTNDQANPCQWNSYALIPSNGVYTIKTLANGGEDYLGLWTPSNDYINGQELAGNRGDGEQGKFLIYRKRIENANLTSYIKNPSFDSNAEPWVLTQSGNEGYHVFGWVNTGGIEEYNYQNIMCKQTITNLPNGIYKVTVQGYYRGGDGGYAGDARNAKLFANDEEVDIMSINDYKGITEKPTTGNWRQINSAYYVPDNTVAANYAINTLNQYNNEVTVAVSNGTLTIGVKKDATVGNDWTYFDNFALTYIEGLHDLTPVSGKMKASVEAAQTAAVNAYNSNKTVENYFAAKAAIAAAEASVAAYANAASYLEKVEGVLATTNFYSQDAYKSVYGTYKTEYENNTLNDATAASLSYKVAGSGGTARYDANTANNLLIPGWTIGETPASTTNSGFYINTWSTESEGSGDAADFANPFYEYWVGSGSLPAKVLSGTLTGLTPNTMYRVTANVRIQGTANSGKIKMQVGTGGEIDVTKGNQIGTTTRYIKDYVAVGKTDADGKLTLKFTVESESGISWLSFRDVMYAEQDDDFTYIIKQADCNTTSQEYWPGNGRTTATGEHYSGDENRVYFTFTSGEDRHQDVTFPATGKYLLKTAVRCKVANTIATMSVGDVSATTTFASSENCYVIGTDGSETTTVNSDGGNWVYNELYFDANAGDVKTITIQLTSKDNVGETDCGGMTLTYLGTEGTLVGMEVSVVAKAGTFVAPFDVVIPARTSAYTVKAAGNGYITLEVKAAAGATLAANTPVILYAEDGIASKISKQFYGTATGSANVNGDGYLIGMYNSDGTIEASAQNYVMQYNSTAGKPEFRQVTTPNFTTTAYRSYLKLNANNESRVVITFEGEDPTAINAIEAAEAEDGALKDGKYLIDGKIVIVKNGVKYGANGQKLN